MRRASQRHSSCTLHLQSVSEGVDDTGQPQLQDKLTALLIALGMIDSTTANRTNLEMFVQGLKNIQATELQAKASFDALPDSLCHAPRPGRERMGLEVKFSKMRRLVAVEASTDCCHGASGLTALHQEGQLLDAATREWNHLCFVAGIAAAVACSIKPAHLTAQHECPAVSSMSGSLPAMGSSRMGSVWLFPG